MENKIGLFGWNRDRNDNMVHYQTALIKFMIEDDDFYDLIRDSLDVNEDFFGDWSLRRIAGTVVDMRAKYGKITYEALDVEIARWSDEYDHEEGVAWLEKIRGLVLDKDDETLYKEQFKYWRSFVLLARLANTAIDFIKEPYQYSEGRLVKKIDEVIEYAHRLERARDAAEIHNTKKGGLNDW